MVKLLLTAFINGNSTPLRNMLKSRIVYSTILQKISEENTENFVENITQNLYGDYHNYFNLHTDQIILTAILFSIATYHNYNIVYNKKIYTASFTKNVKIIVMCILCIFSKNIDSVE
jgi:hypothetical protein